MQSQLSINNDGIRSVLKERKEEFMKLSNKEKRIKSECIYNARQERYGCYYFIHNYKTCVGPVRMCNKCYQEACSLHMPIHACDNFYFTKIQ